MGLSSNLVVSDPLKERSEFAGIPVKKVGMGGKKRVEHLFGVIAALYPDYGLLELLKIIVIDHEVG